MNTTIKSAWRAGTNHTLTLDTEVGTSMPSEFYDEQAQKLYDFLMLIPSGTLDRCVAELMKNNLIFRKIVENDVKNCDRIKA